jgi:hypothetical protein
MRERSAGFHFDWRPNRFHQLLGRRSRLLRRFGVIR